MPNLKIGIVEDELLIARSIQQALAQLGYHYTEPCISYTEAIQMIATEKPDLVLLDINLSGRKDGIDVAEIINSEYKIPFIFLTANSDSVTIDRAKKVGPNAYLVKPFNIEELFASIEIAISNFNTKQQHSVQPISIEEHKEKAIFIREQQSYFKLLLKEILFIESEENYVRIHTQGGKRVMVRSTFTDFLKQLPESLFYRTGRSHAVQLSLIEKIDPTEVHLAGHRIPVSKTYRDDLFLRLGIK